MEKYGVAKEVIDGFTDKLQTLGFNVKEDNIIDAYFDIGFSNEKEKFEVFKICDYCCD